MNIEDVIFNRYMGQSSASTLSSSPAGKIISIFYQKGVTVRGNALAITLVPKVEHEFVPWDPLQQLWWPHMAQSWPFLPWGSYSALPTLQLGGGESSAMSAPRHTGMPCWHKAGAGCPLLESAHMSAPNEEMWPCQPPCLSLWQHPSSSVCS